MNKGKRARVAYFEHFAEEGQPPHRVKVRSSPFTIGRSDSADHTIYSRRVSGIHVELVSVGEGYVVRDMGSTNGTFINGARVREGWLQSGDVLHVAQHELRFVVAEKEVAEPEPTLAGGDGSGHQQLFKETTDLVAVLDSGAVSAVFQPIVTLKDRRRVAYETLGRPALPDQGYSVGDLFRIAGQRGEAATLSRLMRERALECLPRLAERPVAIFFNLHPAEMSDFAAVEQTLAGIADALGEGQDAVLEIHESAVTDPVAMKRISEAVSAHSIQLAYDDFGAGQSRLMELVEVPPDFLKLDMALVRDIDTNEKRQTLVGALVAVMRGEGIRVLAEGVETDAEAVACAALGCELGQGFHFGRPAPV